MVKQDGERLACWQINVSRSDGSVDQTLIVAKEDRFGVKRSQHAAIEAVLSHKRFRHLQREQLAVAGELRIGSAGVDVR